MQATHPPQKKTAQRKLFGQKTLKKQIGQSMDFWAARKIM